MWISTLVPNQAALACALLVIATLRAQGPAAVNEPEFVNQFFLLSSEGKLIPLEQQKTRHEIKSHNRFVTNSVTREATLPGRASPVRVPRDAHFVVKIMASNIDPATVVSLRPFRIERDSRALRTSEAKGHIFGGVTSGTAADDSIALSFSKFGERSLEIVPSQPLVPGEYALASAGGVFGSVSCFGVDPDSK